MTHARVERHVYLREITQDKRTSLSVLAGMIAPGSRVLDLGTGSGALGQYLSEHLGCTVDGVTINSTEAELARPYYRRVEVANLEQPDWGAKFGDERYDFIVCADVLEHLREPEKALRACSGLLAPRGAVLISVPNAAYSGLVAELLEGEFAYRDEGLLDRTHLRFFTRRSLQQFLQAEGWAVGAMERIDMPLADSEFRASFDKLPPAVARYLLGLPDAGTYQFVVAARPAEDAAITSGFVPPEPALLRWEPAPAQFSAQFSAQLYRDDGAGYREDGKIVVHGVIGKSRQLLRFPLPEPRLTRLRLDPADRPGFLHLYRIRLLAGAATLWEWCWEKDGLAPLEAAPHHDLVLQAPWMSAMALVLLHGDDPFIELPIPADALRACRGRTDVALEVELGWPMSGDFMALAEVVHPLAQHVESLRASAAQTGNVIARANARAEEQQELHRELSEKLSVTAERLRTSAAQSLRLSEENKAIAAQKLALEGRLVSLELDRVQMLALTEQNQRLNQERNQLARHRLKLEGQLTKLGKEYEALGNHLRWIESSTVFRATRPLVHAKMAIERMLGRRPPQAPAALPAPESAAPRAETVDVIVPVYRGLADTQLCVNSVLASRCVTPWRLVVINDASPEPEVTQWLREASGKDSRIVLLENDHNLGFVATVNRGMALSDAHDVLLLNSDTEVANDWLDRLRAAAYSDARVASVTPFSNNATICSYPRFCEPNELPPGCDTARLDALFAATNAGHAVDVPTGVGFCMYVRRDSLDAVGLFDVANFGKGYGEENDFCRRAAAAGWRNLHALDTFVLHTGGVSFGPSKSQREIDAVAKMGRLHPGYDALVHAFVNTDPARLARLAVDLARVRSTQRPSVLAVVHNRGGGTLRHAIELAQHLAARANFFLLSPVPGHGVCLELLESGAGFKLEFALPAQWPSLLQALRALPISHVHYHHVLGHGAEVLGLAEELGVPWDFTAHDFYMMCPHISLTDANDRYCGEQGGGECSHCWEPTAASGGRDLASWRLQHGQLLTRARHVLVPSRDAARRFARMWPAADVRLAPHTDIATAADLPSPQVALLAPNAPLRVAVIGAISKIKGADLLEDVAMLAARQGRPVEFHLIGYAYRDLHKQPRAALTVHGAYEEKDLPSLLSWLKPDVVWFPALWPETYSYTLSACLVAGLPVVAPSIGAFAERLSGRPWSWVQAWDMTPAEWLNFFVQAREQNFVTGRSPVPPLFIDSVADQRIKPWSYDSEYFEGLQVLAATPMPDEFLARHRPGQATGLAAQKKGLKQAALTSLVHLRSAPVLSGIARAIPLQWQRRVKGWLRA